MHVVHAVGHVVVLQSEPCLLLCESCMRPKSPLQDICACRVRVPPRSSSCAEAAGSGQCCLCRVTRVPFGSEQVYLESCHVVTFGMYHVCTASTSARLCDVIIKGTRRTAASLACWFASATSAAHLHPSFQASTIQLSGYDWLCQSCSVTRVRQC